MFLVSGRKRKWTLYSICLNLIIYFLARKMNGFNMCQIILIVSVICTLVYQSSAKPDGSSCVWASECDSHRCEWSFLMGTCIPRYGYSKGAQCQHDSSCDERQNLWCKGGSISK